MDSLNYKWALDQWFAIRHLMWMALNVSEKSINSYFIVSYV